MSQSQEENNKKINPSRLTIARHRNKFTKKKLATLVGKTSRSITAWESDSESLSALDESVDNLAKVLGFPKEFFFGEDIEKVSPESASFRALSKMSAKDRDAALAAGDMGVLLHNWVESHFDLPPTEIPELRYESPHAASFLLRQAWGIGQKPIANLVHLLESKGVRVFSLSEDCDDVDAFSFWRKGIPFVFLNMRKTAERSRFDAAHELGHLILHKNTAPTGIEAEREADDFASAFLMPADSMYSSASTSLTFENLIKIKLYWRVSLFALVVRMHRLSLISEWKYRSLCIEFRQKFARTEPHGIERECSQIFNKVFKSLWSEGITVNDIADELSLPVNEIRSLVFSLMGSTADLGREEERVLRLVT